MRKLISRIKQKCAEMMNSPEESGDLSRLEKEIGYKFKNRKLLIEALTHPSYRYESKSIDNDNQRLEFLGDAVISMAVSTRLYGKYKDSDEGMLTSYRSMLTSGRALAVFANELKLGKWLLIGKGEEKSSGRTRTSTLADVFESVVGAVYIDGGMEPVVKLLDRLMKQQVNCIDDKLDGHNPKGRLQEYCQKELKISPLYRVVDSTGPAHSRVFVVEVSAGSISAIGKGRSKQEAERNAAVAAIAQIGGLA
jgi:ribonuclease-3